MTDETKVQRSRYTDINSSLKRIAWAYGSSKKDSETEKDMLKLLRKKMATTEAERTMTPLDNSMKHIDDAGQEMTKEEWIEIRLQCIREEEEEENEGA